MHYLLGEIRISPTKIILCLSRTSKHVMFTTYRDVFRLFATFHKLDRWKLPANLFKMLLASMREGEGRREIEAGNNTDDCAMPHHAVLSGSITWGTTAA